MESFEDNLVTPEVTEAKSTICEYLANTLEKDFKIRFASEKVIIHVNLGNLTAHDLDENITSLVDIKKVKVTYIFGEEKLIIEPRPKGLH